MKVTTRFAGEEKEVIVGGGATVRDVLVARGVPADSRVRVNGDVVDLDDQVEEGDVISMAPKGQEGG